MTKTRNRKPRYCSLPDCEDKHYAKTYCIKHYFRWRNHGDPYVLKGTAHGDGKTYINEAGYVRVPMSSNPYKYRLQHQVVMSELLGRELYPGENVHHKNGIRHDNSPENLEIWVTSQPAGQRPEDLVAWAKEILERYDVVSPVRQTKD